VQLSPPHRSHPLTRNLRIGLVGLGQRGADALHTLSLMPHVEVTAICDFYEERVALQKKWLRENGKRPPKYAFSGEEGWKALCECDVDLVYNATPWALHVPVALYAMEHGKAVATEVPAAFTVEDCWALVETSERTGLPCIQLENCCYGETELLTLQMVRAGLFGELKHAECAYVHDLRKWCYDELVMDETAYGKTGYFDHWRLKWNAVHKGNQYPTHGLMPVCRYLDIGKTDRLDYLVSLESQPCGFHDWIAHHPAATNYPLSSINYPLAMGDVNTTLVKTKLGRSILIQHDVASPRPYTRINQLVGTRGILQDYPLRMAFETANCQLPTTNSSHKWFSTARTKRWAAKYRHPLWVEQGEMAKKVGGHGGMDFLMILRLCECLRNGEPLDMDVYDLATTCCICELTEKSVRHKSRPQDVPDFTRHRS